MKNPLPVLLCAVSVGMCAFGAYAGLRGFSGPQADLDGRATPPSAERPLPKAMIGVAGQTAARWNSTVKVTASLAESYISMAKPVPGNFMQWTEADAAGATPVIEILPRGRSRVKGLVLQKIIEGKDDGWLDKLKAELHEKVIIAFGPEADGSWYTWGGQPALFIKAWRHVVREIGRKNVTWLWQMSAHLNFTPYWPGKKYVSWVGLDGYYEESGASFDSMFGHPIRLVRKFTHRPVLLSETAVGPRTTQVATDIRGLFAGATSEHIIGVIWFERKQSGRASKEDWLLVDKPRALSAFRSAAQLFEHPGGERPAAVERA